MNDNYKGVLCVIGLLTVVGFIATYLWSGGQIPPYLTDPETGPLLQALNHMTLVPETLGENCPVHPYQPGFHSYMVPDFDTNPRVFTPHRYPRVSGGNMTLVMHKGWSSMMRPGPNDADWADLPPADSNECRAGTIVGYSL